MLRGLRVQGLNQEQDKMDMQSEDVGWWAGMQGQEVGGCGTACVWRGGCCMCPAVGDVSGRVSRAQPGIFLLPGALQKRNEKRSFLTSRTL